MKLITGRSQGIRQALFGTVATFALAGSALATWSIVAVNTKTGEVCIASATCIEDFDLQATVAVLEVGKGAAACQSAIDQTGKNRLCIWNEMKSGLDAQQLLARVLAQDTGFQARQYGIVTFEGFPATFTGTADGQAAYGVCGIDDDIRYAIQGNVLTGVAVVYNAESKLLSTKGDMSQKVMAAMEAARVMGGDGRCSCDFSHPTQCGSPPPHFTYSAYTAFIAVARIGDLDGECNVNDGCASGNYYLDIKMISDGFGVEPVLGLEARYFLWRESMHGITDGVLSTITTSSPALPADGLTHEQVVVQLNDIDHNPVIHEPVSLEILQDDGNTGIVTFGPPVNTGPGQYTFDVTASTTPGQGKWFVIAHGPTTNVRLYPDFQIRVDPLTALHSGFDQVSAASDIAVPLVLNSMADAGAPYIVLGSSSGTSPGVVFDGLALPLNADWLLHSSFANAGTQPFVGTIGALDSVYGHAEASFVEPAMALTSYIGRHFDWCGVIMSGTPHVTNLAGFDIVP
jgi:hypothetical protein